MLPSAKAEPERYRGRPLLIILENYVLDVIGALSLERQQGIARIVDQVFGGEADWKATVREQLELSDSIDDHLRGMWARNQRLAAEQGIDLQPVQFAKMVVDGNFAHLIGPPPN